MTKTSDAKSISLEFKEFREKMENLLISKNPEIKDFLNSSCSDSVFSKIGEQIIFTIFMIVNDYHFRKTKKSFFSFYSSIMDILGFDYCDLSIKKIHKIISKDLDFNLEISFKKEKGLYSLEFEWIEFELN
ncbi:MAG: hypothetical protein WC264_00380 [Candidatus Paceibacterota bacterium]|jgi:hypothetical protein